VLHLVLGSSVQERHRHTGVSPVEGHKDGSGIGASDIQGEAERGGTIQSREEKVQGDLIHVYKYLMG